jgi:DNA-binding NarL/FixJ family response regulator
MTTPTYTYREACELIEQGLAAQPDPEDHQAQALAEAATAMGWRRPLTVREVQVIALLCEGLTRAQIGEQLGLSTLTVKTHLARIGAVVGVGDRAGIVGACFRAGVIQ